MYVTVECDTQKEAEMIEEELFYEQIPFKVKQVMTTTNCPDIDREFTQLIWVYTFEYHDKLI